MRKGEHRKKARRLVRVSRSRRDVAPLACAPRRQDSNRRHAAAAAVELVEDMGIEIRDGCAVLEAGAGCGVEGVIKVRIA